MKILVTGANGQLGQELQVVAKHYPQDVFIFVGRDEMPLNHPAQINSVLDRHNPDFIINAAAYTAVDKAESEPELTDLVNHQAVASMAKWAKKHSVQLIHVSTDYVFQGDSSTPLTESEETNPINVYGSSKQKGEQAILQSGADAVIIRTAWVYSTYGANFVKTMIRLMTERDEISVISDQIGSPTYAYDLAMVILTIAHSDKWNSGIYHYSNEGKTSWYDFAIAIRDVRSLDCRIKPISTEQYPTPAKRPRYSLLDKTKIKDTFAIEIPNWEESLRLMVGKL